MTGRKIFTLLNKEISGIHYAAYLLAFFTFLSQLLALLRDRLLAHYFGAGSELDVYYAAFRVPDLIFVSVASIVSISVVVPLLSRKIKEDKEEAKRFVQSLAMSFFVLISFVSLIIFFLIPYIQPFLFSGFSEGQINDVIFLSRLLLISPILLGFSNILAGVTQTLKKFFVYALAPVLYNLGIIIGIVGLRDYGITGVVVGVLGGALLHAFIQIPFVYKAGFTFSGPYTIRFQEVLDVVKESLPRTMTLGMSHFVILAMLALASQMKEGSISVFTFAYNLQSVPLSIIGVSYSLAAFPTLSTLFVEKKFDAFVSNISAATRHIIFWSVPVIALFVVLRAQIVRVILGSGSFDWADTRLTAAALAFFVISVVFQNITLLYVRSFYAMGKTKIPLYVSLGTSALSILGSFILFSLYQSETVLRESVEWVLRVEGLKGTEMVVLPLSFAIGAVLNGSILVVLMHREYRLRWKKIWRGISDSFLASCILAVVAYYCLNLFSLICNLQTLRGIFFQGLFSGLVGIFAGLTFLFLVRNKELLEMVQALRRRYKKNMKIAGPEPDVVG